jgi:deazaflavin-dependent oxidoreductase (nitroreductase family)
MFATESRDETLTIISARPASQQAAMQTITDSYPIPYPTGLLRLLLRLPLLAYRLGLGDWLNAIHLMVLTTRGRKSGKPRSLPIEYRRHGSKIYLISGWGEQPQWYQNLLATPLATVQMGQRTSAVRASVVTDPAEALRALFLFRRTAPARYDAVLSRLIEDTVNARTLPELSNQFTIIRLDLTGEAPPMPGVAASLTWVWPLALVSATALLALAVVARLRQQSDQA